MKAAALAGIAALCAMPTHAFDSFEHRYLGSMAYAQARATWSADASAEEALKAAETSLGIIDHKILDARDQALLGQGEGPEIFDGISFEFGDLTALAGDLAGSTIDLRDLARTMTTRATRHGILVSQDHDGSDNERTLTQLRRQWVSACRWVVSARPRDFADFEPLYAHCFDSLPRSAGSAIPVHRFATAGYSATRAEAASFEMLPRYVALAAQNEDHFPARSWVKYVTAHRKALELARCYRAGARRCGGSEGASTSGLDDLAAALLFEAYGQHFLQDSFASGHIGTQGKSHWVPPLTYVPSKETIQQSHDILNALGLSVKLIQPVNAAFLSGLEDSEVPGRQAALSKGWTGFGDDHLFIPEADFHRNVVLQVATFSVAEVLRAALADVPSRVACMTCTTNTFPIPASERIVDIDADFKGPGGEHPIPVEVDANRDNKDLVQFSPAPEQFDSLSKDQRIPEVPREGLKFGVSWTTQNFGWQHGWLGNTPHERGGSLNVDYMRSFGANLPNHFGVQMSYLRDYGALYQGTVGYLWPRVHANVQYGLTGKFGLRVLDPETQWNSEPRRQSDLYLTLPSLTYIYTIYHPFSLFVDLSLYSRNLTHHKSDTIFNGHTTAMFGVLIDGSGL